MWVNYLKNPDHKCHKCPADILMSVIISLSQLNNNKVTTITVGNPKEFSKEQYND